MSSKLKLPSASARNTRIRDVPRALKIPARKTPEIAPHAKAVPKALQGSMSSSSAFLIDLR